MVFMDQMNPQTGLIDNSCHHPGVQQALQAEYANAQPFPHIVIDDFLPQGIAQACLDEFDRLSAGKVADAGSFDRAQERAKTQYSPEQLTERVRQILYAFNSRPFIKVLEGISGITGLIPDPDFLGGGLHEIGNGGHLSVHADFNHHKRLNLERRINLLIYLNRDWRDEYGGQLELWSDDMSRCVKSVVPLFNRAVMFNTTSASNHGNPNPVAHPAGISRKSIALYYYTATWDGSKRAHTTRFRARPDSPDQTDWSVRLKELARDFVPPVIARTLGNRKR